MQLVFGRDAILNIKFEADWNLINQRKQARINANNQKENAKRTPHKYQQGDQVLVSTRQDTKFGQDPWEGPYQILNVTDNGTVVL